MGIADMTITPERAELYRMIDRQLREGRIVAIIPNTQHDTGTGMGTLIISDDLMQLAAHIDQICHLHYGPCDSSLH